MKKPAFQVFESAPGEFYSPASGAKLAQTLSPALPVGDLLSPADRMLWRETADQLTEEEVAQFCKVGRFMLLRKEGKV